MAKVAAEVGSTANDYEILAKLATGGMADIFLARGASVAGVERYCVLKRILRDAAGDAQLVQMFLDEARLAAQLQHPNIASVYDVGKLGDSYFFTMEYVHGETVGSLIQRSVDGDRLLPLACVLTIVAGAAAGLHHAHERNGVDGRALQIVHRDVSPSNLMVSYEGSVKVVDFGVAKAAHRASETRSGRVKGKISYMSPEQCRSQPLDRRSDLFSLGIVMWEMLTGDRLYRRDSDFAIMTAIIDEAPVSPSVVRPDVPREVDDIVRRLLAKPAADRFQSAAEVVDQIEAVALRAGMMLSTAALGRFVGELFGRRPEPWLELESGSGSAQTELASESAPSYAEIELELAAVPEIGIASTHVALEPERRSGPPAWSAPRRLAPAAAPVIASAGFGTQSTVALKPVAITTGERPSPVERRRRAWLPAAMLVGVAVAGVVAAWLAMRPGPPAQPTRPAAVEPAVQTPPQVVPPDAVVVAVALPVEAEPASDRAAGHQAVDIADAKAPPPPVQPVAPARTGSQPITPKPRASSGHPKQGSTSRPATPQRLAPTPEDVAELSACGGTVMSARRAPGCTRVACRSGATDKAIKWVAYVPAAQRAELTSLCKERGVDLTTQRLDCTADAAACP